MTHLLIYTSTTEVFLLLQYDLYAKPKILQIYQNKGVKDYRLKNFMSLMDLLKNLGSLAVSVSS